MLHGTHATNMNCLEGPPLPEPSWGEPSPPLKLTMAEYERLIPKAEEILRTLLCQENYDSVNGLLNFYDTYKSQKLCLYSLFRNYVPEIHPKKLTCVGLALELIRRWHDLDNEFQDFAKSCMVVSCEQAVEGIEDYVASESPKDVPRVDKEHVLVAVNVIIDGRSGVLLGDPGYHLSQIVTVMLDEKPPQSGWILQTDVPECRKEFYYMFNKTNSKYVEWHERKTTSDSSDRGCALIYVAKPFLKGVDITIRRNLVYEFRSILARYKNGRVKAGVYFKIRPKHNMFTLLTDNGSCRNKYNYNFEVVFKRRVPVRVRHKVAAINSVLAFKKGELLNLLKRVSVLVKDTTFVTQMLEVNKYIQSYSRNRPSTHARLSLK